MLLAIVFDIKENTFSHPLVAPDLSTLESSLQTLNPSNLPDIQILPILEFSTLSDLLSLQVSPGLGENRFPHFFKTAEKYSSQGQESVASAFPDNQDHSHG